ncbi:MAG TPA: ABC transporter substrate-binding protein [bacterium]|nr:ABC transporter substrate-binding protein [bacterium]
MRTERGWWQRGMAVVLAGALVFVMLASAQGQNVTTVTLWSWTPDAPFMKKMVAAFEKDHPSIHIETTIQPSSTYWTALKAAAGSNSLPDIVGLSAGSNTQIYRPFLQSLNGMAAQFWGADWQSKFPPVAIRQMQLGNPAGDHNDYILPQETEVLNLWYNTAIFSKLHLTFPRDITQLVRDVQIIRKAGYVPFYQGGASANFTWWTFMEIANQFDPATMLAAQEGKPVWTQPSMLHAMQVWKQLFASGVYQQGALADFQYPTGANLFAGGRVAMMLLGSWWLQETMSPPPLPPAVQNFTFAIAPFPAMTSGGHPSPYIGGIDFGWGMTKAAAARQDAAAQVLKSLISGPMEQESLNSLDDLPAFAGMKPTIPLSPHLMSLYQQYINLLPHTQSHQIGNPDVAQALVTAMQSVAAGKLDPTTALKQVNSVAVAQQSK